MVPPYILTIVEIVLFVSMALCSARLIAGPSAADRMVAIDLLGLLVGVLMITHVIRSQDEAVLDVVLVFSLVAFFGTSALARYLQRESDEPANPKR